MARPTSLRADQARRCTLGAQGLLAPRPATKITRRHIRKVFDRLGVIQMDSVNVLVRSHYLPFFSRLGPYDTRLLDDAAGRHHDVFEYWAHEASLVPVEHHHLLRWRMHGPAPWSGMRRWKEEHGHLLGELRERVYADGPVSAGDLDERDGTKGPWWDWSAAKQALEVLFRDGEVAALRRGHFERVYCHPRRAIGAEHLDRPTPPEDDAKRELLLMAARAHGLGTAKDLADYWRLKVGESTRLLDGLVGDGALESVRVEGWTRPAYKHPDATVPRRAAARALVSPFDQAMWERDRVERVFGFHYRIEIYVPKPKRRFGYYVLPFLLGDSYVARVDLKADRAARALLVQSSHGEDGVDDEEVADALADELRLLADWLELDDIVVKPHGDLAGALGSMIG